ncbi:MAG: hypothetical protein MHM6MM_005782 [Cercozoa sp. M6MM]
MTGAGSAEELPQRIHWSDDDFGFTSKQRNHRDERPVMLPLPLFSAFANLRQMRLRLRKLLRDEADLPTMWEDAAQTSTTPLVETDEVDSRMLDADITSPTTDVVSSRVEDESNGDQSAPMRDADDMRDIAELEALADLSFDQIGNQKEASQLKEYIRQQRQLDEWQKSDKKRLKILKLRAAFDVIDRQEHQLLRALSEAMAAPAAVHFKRLLRQQNEEDSSLWTASNAEKVQQERGKKTSLMARIGLADTESGSDEEVKMLARIRGKIKHQHAPSKTGTTLSELHDFDPLSREQVEDVLRDFLIDTDCRIDAVAARLLVEDRVDKHMRTEAMISMLAIGIAEHLERRMLPVTVPNATQVKRALYALDTFVAFFEEQSKLHDFAIKVLERVRKVCMAWLCSPKALIDMHANSPWIQQGPLYAPSENVRVRTSPFVAPLHIATVLRAHALNGDAEAEKFAKGIEVHMRQRQRSSQPISSTQLQDSTSDKADAEDGSH